MSSATDSAGGTAGSPVSSVHAATTLALWAAAWQGGAPSDDVLAALEATGFRAGARALSVEAASVTGLPGPGSGSSGSATLLPLLRGGGIPELLLPAAGDLRGLAPAGRLTVAALDAGAVVVLPDDGIGIVPIHGQWRADWCPGGHPAPDLRTADHELDDAIREATQRLAAADLARDAGSPRERVAQVMLAERVLTPPGTPPRASALLAKAISLHALLAVAENHDTAAVNSFELAVVDDALRPLALAVRDGRRAAVADACTALVARARV